jgi:hypothetical protein
MPNTAYDSQSRFPDYQSLWLAYAPPKSHLTNCRSFSTCILFPVINMSACVTGEREIVLSRAGDEAEVRSADFVVVSATPDMRREFEQSSV